MNYIHEPDLGHKISLALTVYGAFKRGRSKEISLAKEYIYFKLVNIADNYPKFRKFKGLPKWIEKDSKKLETYIDKVKKEDSHITFKLRQAINYVQYGLYAKKNEFDIFSLVNEIQNIKQDLVIEQSKDTSQSKKSPIRTIDFVPPSFLSTDIIFTHSGNFEQFSSGEKQQIFSINTIAYHLYNINSVMDDVKTLKYNSINIVFDEVELYFHPDMQRTYIKELRKRIISLELSDIKNINIVFVTHSPFILSDIPSFNVLRLEDGYAKKFDAKEQTFGANIHDLLANDFFLKNGFVGAYARDQIINLIDYLKLPEKENLNNQNWSQESAEKLISFIGEPLVRESLLRLFDKKFFIQDKVILEKRINELTKELQKLTE